MGVRKSLLTTLQERMKSARPQLGDVREEESINNSPGEDEVSATTVR